MLIGVMKVVIRKIFLFRLVENYLIILYMMRVNLSLLVNLR